MGVEPKIGVNRNPAKCMVKTMENPMNKWMIWGGFTTPIFGNMFSDSISQTLPTQLTMSGMIQATCWQGISAQEFSMKAWNLRYSKIWAIYNDLSRRLVTPNCGFVRESPPKWP